MCRLERFPAGFASPLRQGVAFPCNAAGVGTDFMQEVARKERLAAIRVLALDRGEYGNFATAQVR